VFPIPDPPPPHDGGLPSHQPAGCPLERTTLCWETQRRRIACVRTFFSMRIGMQCQRATRSPPPSPEGVLPFHLPAGVRWIGQPYVGRRCGGASYASEPFLSKRARTSLSSSTPEVLLTPPFVPHHMRPPARQSTWGGSPSSSYSSFRHQELQLTASCNRLHRGHRYQANPPPTCFLYLARGLEEMSVCGGWCFYPTHDRF
jgi:hypothetical protein